MRIGFAEETPPPHEHSQFIPLQRQRGKGERFVFRIDQFSANAIASILPGFEGTFDFRLQSSVFSLLDLGVSLEDLYSTATASGEEVRIRSLDDGNVLPVELPHTLPVINRSRLPVLIPKDDGFITVGSLDLPVAKEPAYPDAIYNFAKEYDCNSDVATNALIQSGGFLYRMLQYGTFFDTTADNSPMIVLPNDHERAREL